MTPEEVDGMFRRIQSDPELRFQISIARRAGLPHSMVMDMWKERDFLIEAGMDKFEAYDALHRCSSCGTDPDEIFSPEGIRGGISEGALWQIEEYICRTCEALAEFQAIKIEKKTMNDYEPPKPVARVVPRREGEPFMPEMPVWAEDSLPPDES